MRTTISNRRFIVFLGLFNLIAVAMLAGSAAMVQLGWMKTLAHRNVGWAAVIPLFAYLVLSLRLIVRLRGGNEDLFRRTGESR